MIIFLITLISTLLIIPIFIKIMQIYKIGQIIREEGPEAHLKKTGTITMGGIPFIFITILVFLIYRLIKGFDCRSMLIVYMTVAFSIVGFIDDYIKNIKHSPYGLKARESLFLQIIFSIPFIYLVQKPDSGYLNYIFIFLFEIFFILSVSNSINITDGLDGLLTGISIPILMVYFLLNTGNYIGDYSLILTAALIGFLFYNFYPAKIFMGNIGSFAIGGAVSAIAVLTGTEFLFLILGAIFVIESLSVIIQVLYFKYTKRKYGSGKRIFKMSPIHHHFELLGYSEPLIVIRFWIFQVILSSISIIIFNYFYIINH